MNQAGVPRSAFRAEELAELDALAGRTDAEIDLSDISEIRDWSGARRGLLYRPVKQQLTLELDAELIDWLGAHATDCPD